MKRRPVVHPDASADPADWRPMDAATMPRPQPIDDPVLEPLWSGRRVLIHVTDAAPRIRLVDRAGGDRTEEVGDLAAAILASVAAGDAVIDAVLTGQPTRGGVGSAILTGPKMSLKGLLIQRGGDVEVDTRGLPPEGELACVAVDLLRVDGTTLLDLPLLERKRLLESVIVPGDRVRLSPVVQPPVDPWVATWHGSGLKGGMLKDANSRYLPGERTLAWRPVTRIASGR